jgi:PAS domain S-box-containing protein
MALTLCLTAGLVSFLWPQLAGRRDEISWFHAAQGVRGLVAVVVLFFIHTVFQRRQIQRVRRELFRHEELFRLISDNATDMIAVVDLGGRHLYHSASYENVLGYTAEELKDGQTTEQIHREDVDRVEAANERAWNTGGAQTVEYRFRHKTGTWLTLESTTNLIGDLRGQPKQLVIVTRDITERKLAQEARRLSDAGFRSVVEDAPYGIYRSNSEGQLLRANPALQKMLGYESTADLLKVNLEREIFRTAGDFRRLNAVLDSAEEFKDVEAEWVRKDGTPITVKCSGRRFVWDGGKPACYEMFVEDITDKRILERQLRMAGKMEAIGRLSGGIAHDFNNLLGVIIGYSELLKRALGPGNALTGHAVEIEKAGDRAAGLTRQLLAFSRQQILSPTVVNLNDLVADMEKMLDRVIGEDIRVTITLDPKLCAVRADRNQIEQVILNLAVNARDAMPEGGRLRIDTRNERLDEGYVRLHAGAKAGEYVCLSVSDTGTGMDAATLAHIFEPFFTTKEMGKGTGLGLATVYGIVKQSGGYVWVESEPGRGACFQIYLPRIAEVAERAAEGEVREGNLRGTETILLVEDAESLRSLAANFLRAHGFTVLAAPHAEHAVEIAAANAGRIQMLVTDVIMPGQNGRVLAERLVAAYPAMKVLYISGYTDAFIAGHGVLGPDCHLLNKPFTAQALVRKVREVLDEKKGPSGKVMALAAPSAAAGATERAPGKR